MQVDSMEIEADDILDLTKIRDDVLIDVIGSDPNPSFCCSPIKTRHQALNIATLEQSNIPTHQANPTSKRSQQLRGSITKPNEKTLKRTVSLPFRQSLKPSINAPTVMKENVPTTSDAKKRKHNAISELTKYSSRRASSIIGSSQKANENGNPPKALRVSTFSTPSCTNTRRKVDPRKKLNCKQKPLSQAPDENHDTNIIFNQKLEEALRKGSTGGIGQSTTGAVVHSPNKTVETPKSQWSPVKRRPLSANEEFITCTKFSFQTE